MARQSTLSGRHILITEPSERAREPPSGHTRATAKGIAQLTSLRLSTAPAPPSSEP